MKIHRHPMGNRGRALMVVLLLAWVLAPPAALLVAQEQRPSPEPAASPPAKKPPETLLELVVAGGPMMIPIGLCSLIALGIALERLFSLRRSVVAPSDFLGKLKGALGDITKPDIEGAVGFCQSHKTPIAGIFRPGIGRLPHGREATEKAIEDAGGREVQKMKRSLRPLSSIANIATLLGLLGTVYGLITAFRASAQQTVGKAQTLAEGIYIALVTTAAGLTVAIPVLVLYLWFCARVDKLADSIDDQANDFVEYALLCQGGSGSPQPPPSVEPALETGPSAAGGETA